MTDRDVAQRFHTAAARAAARLGPAVRLSALLRQLGIPGLAARLGLDPVPQADPAAHRLHQLYDTLALEEARRIGAALDHVGVAHFFAKGVALLGSLYQPGDRVISDLDLYVAAPDRDRTVGRLAALGYAPLGETDQAGPPSLRSSLALSRQATAEPERVALDLHFAIDPVRRLLPRPDHPVPARIWNQVETPHGIRVPTAEHHAALLAHHLAHGDLLHVRGVLDLALLFAGFPPGAGGEYRLVAGELGVGSIAGGLARLVARDLGVSRPRAETGTGPRLLERLTLDQLLTRAARTARPDQTAITPDRIRTRVALLGWRSAPALAADILAPPAAFLEWRWGGTTRLGRLIRHYGQIAKKVVEG